MENNKGYLQKIHWILLLALPGAILLVFSTESFPDISAYGWILAKNGIHRALFFTGLAILTGQPKKAALSFALYIPLYLSYWFFTQDSHTGFWVYMTLFVAVPLAPCVFIWQHSLKRRWWQVYLLMVVAEMVFHLGSYSVEELGSFLRSLFDIRSDIVIQLINVLFIVVSFTTATIFVMEVINYVKKKDYFGKTSLLNLGNDYPRANSLIVIWVLKLMCILLVFGAINFFKVFSRFFSRDSGFYEERPGLLNYLRVTNTFDMVEFIIVALLLGWYMRKFLLEFFISYNLSPKFLYWFSLLPVIGFLALLYAQTDSPKQHSYKERVAALDRLAYGSTASVTTIIFILFILRTISLISSGEGILLISPLISMLFFVWLAADKTGYYVNMALTILLLLTLIVLLVVHDNIGDMLPAMFGLALMNLIHLVLIFPVYHFGEFEFIPAENPDPESGEEFRLFKETLS